MLLEIGKKDKRYSMAKMAASCIDKGPARYAINFVKLEKNRMMSTDTKRLFVADFSDNVPIPDSGFYSVVKNNGTVALDLVVDEPGKFPEVNYVLKGDRTGPETINFKSDYGISQRVSWILAFCFKRGPLIDCDSIRPLLAMEGVISVQFSMDKPEYRPVLFSGETTAGKWQYLVMPMTQPSDRE